MAENLTSGTWTASPILAPTDAPDYTFSDLNAVSCVSVGNCIAIGDYRVSTVKTEGFYAVEASGVWARGLVLPVPADAASNPAQTTFDSASCVVGGTTCQLLGEYITTTIPATIHSVIDTYVFGTGLTGTPQEIAQLSGREGIELNAISCSTATNCVAVGSQSETFSAQATFVAENGGTWGTPTVLSNPDDPANPAELLTSISCVSFGNCVAGGNWVDARGNVYAETFTESGGVWGSAVDLGQPSQLGNPFVDDISCVTTVNTCTIVGALSDTMGHLHAATAQMTGGHWGQLAPAGVPAGAVVDHELLGVSCATGVQCTAVGYYNLNTVTGGTGAMAATWSIGSSPGAVTGLHSTAVSPTAAQLAWTAPVTLGTGFDHYEITAKQSGGMPVDKGGVLGTSTAVSKLLPGSTYQLSVVTVASDGQTSSPVSVTVTLPAIVPTPPKITRVVGLPVALRVSWSSPKSTGGAPVTGYYVNANCSGSLKRAHFSGLAHEGTVAGLRAGSSCVVRVTASNRAGTSQPSAAVIGHPLA
jgi:Fibronectin type III domain